MNLFLLRKVILRYIFLILAAVDFFLTLNLFVRDGDIIFLDSARRLLLNILFELFSIMFQPF